MIKVTVKYYELEVHMSARDVYHREHASHLAPFSVITETWTANKVELWMPTTGLILLVYYHNDSINFTIAYYHEIIKEL